MTDSSIITQAQTAWANGLIAIGEDFKHNKDYTSTASDVIDQLYGYNHGDGVVLFKPTKAAQQPFRSTKDAALSYFVGGNPVFAEDSGFALAPWVSIAFHNDQIYHHHDLWLAMGTYVFTDDQGNAVNVEYSFGYVVTENQLAKIVLHHSSLPYAG